jgi:membrane protease YdiL (CAAX protease family)
VGDRRLGQSEHRRHRCGKLQSLFLPAALIVSIIMFGIGHIYQGLSGVILTSATGALMLGVYAATKSLWFVAAFHALVDYEPLSFSAGCWND